MAEQLPHLEGVLQDKLIEVADYQRPYAWERKQLQDLWEDLDLLGSERHYAGTLVLQRTDRSAQTEAGNDLTVYEVVDGQQRLTTCCILLDRLRRKMMEYDDRGLRGIDGARVDLERLLITDVDGVPRPRLSLGAELNEFFADSILGDEISHKQELVAGEQRLQAAAKYFNDRIDALVADIDEVEGARRLIELRARVCYRLRFLVYEVERSAEVGVLFETLNDRGQLLSELEKVKNYLLYLSRQIEGAKSEALAQSINRAWSDIFTNLAKINIDEDALLRSHWYVTHDPNSRNWNRTASVKAKFPRAKYVPNAGRLEARGETSADETPTRAGQLIADVTDYVESLRRCSAYFRDLYDDRAPYREFDPRVAERVRNLTGALVRGGSVANFRPLLLAARLKYPSDGDLYARLVDLCERFSARVYAICTLRSNAGQSALHWAARDLYLGEDPNKVIDGVTAKLWQLAPDDAVRAGFGPGVDWYYRRSHKYVLYEFELDEVRSASDLPTFGHFYGAGGKTTEHILPQHPADGSQWRRDFSPGEHTRLLNTIGNLVLTNDNSAYSNHDYDRKRGVPGQESPRCYYSTSALARERQIAATYDAWTPASVEARRREIEEWALQRWRVEAPEGVVAEDDEDQIGEAGEPEVIPISV